jgi:hypothetical protein
MALSHRSLIAAIVVALATASAACGSGTGEERPEREPGERRAETPALGESSPEVTSPTGFHTGRDAGESEVAAVCSRGDTVLVCWTPNDGFTVRLPVQGAAYRSRNEEAVRRGVGPPGLPALAFGQTWAHGGFSCQSTKAGLTCHNATGRGFTLPRYRGLPAYL